MAESFHNKLNTQPVRRPARASLNLEGLDCSDCALVIEHRLARLEGVVSARVDFVSQNLHVEYDAGRISQRAIRRRVRQMGYGLPSSGLAARLAADRELLFSIAAGLALLVGFLGARLFGLPGPVEVAFYLAAYLLGGYDITRHALHTLGERRFDTHLLMLVAALGAASLGELAEGGLLLFLFSLGHALEERVLDRARDAVRSLAGLTPKTALVRRGEQDLEIPVESVQIGERVIVRPGGRLPVDGEVVAGQSAVDQSPVTGESLPVEKVPGAAVYAGSVNGEGALEVRTVRLARDSTLARVMAMVEQAQGQKSPTQQVTERFMAVFVPVVLAIDFLLIVVPPLFGAPFGESFLRAMTLLVAVSPCALALGTPAAVLAAVAQAARRGVLLKGGAHLENLGRLRALAFDKTGTLTLGEPQVTDVIPLDGHDRDEVLALAAAAESRSGHPLARAILRAAGDISRYEVGQVTALTGRGVQAQVDGRAVAVGSPALLAETGLQLPAEFDRQREALEGQGKSVMLVACDGRLAGLVAVADTLRPEAQAALAGLKRLGVRQTVMLSGDNPRAAAHIAAQLGMADFRAELLPEDKLRAVAELEKTYGVVGMVGDGVNDAPALAHATVGIAMGGARTDVALETADVALMTSDLGRLPFAVGLGQAARRVIVQNLVIALGVIALLSGLTLAGLAGIGAAIVLHEGSTLLVALNALRLLRYSG